MVQPRKEQIKNLKTKYTRFEQTGSLVLSGGPVQTIQNTLLENYYDNFLNSTVSKAVSGAESSAPAILYGGFGPFGVAAGNSFNLLINGFNNNLPVVITFQSSDIVTLSGSPVITTARVANRINTSLAALGLSTPVATLVDGQLILKPANLSGYVYGENSSITVSDITPGLVNILGFGASNSINAVGYTAPKNGVITLSQDGLGGYLQLKTPELYSVDPAGSNTFHFGNRKYVSEYLPGLPCYGRIQAFPGADINGKNFKITYLRNAPTRPFIVTGQSSVLSNFATIASGDQVTITLTSGTPHNLSVNFTVTFPTITTVQQVVDSINTAWNTQTTSQFGISSTKGSIVLGYSGPYRFSNPSTRDSFFVKFNGNTAIHINPNGLLTASAFASYINSQIAAASQTSEGEAVVITYPDGNPGVVLQSKNSSALSSSVEILPGNPGFTVPGTFMETLDMLGLSPGVYKGTNIAELFGNDEIKIINPSALDGSSITVTFPIPSIATKFGLLSTQTVNSSLGIQKVVIPQSIALIPESLEFSQEPDNYDTYIQDYSKIGKPRVLSPTSGILNSRISSLLGPDGKLLPDLIPRVMGTMSIDQLKLGTNLGASSTDQYSPRLISQQETTKGPVLVWEGSSTTSGAASTTLRLYADGNSAKITQNAYWQGGATPWNRDLSSDSSILEINNGQVFYGSYPSASSAPWADSGWKKNTRINTTGVAGTGFGSEILNLGESLISGTEATVPRVNIPVSTDTMTLVMRSVATGGAAIRLYMKSGIGEASGRFFITSNARWDGTNFNKDVSGISATAFSLGGGTGTEKTGLWFYYRAIASNSPWNMSGWTSTPFYVDPATSSVNTIYSFNSTSDINAGGYLTTDTGLVVNSGGAEITDDVSILSGNLSVSGTGLFTQNVTSLNNFVGNQYTYNPTKTRSLISNRSWYVPVGVGWVPFGSIWVSDGSLPNDKYMYLFPRLPHKCQVSGFHITCQGNSGDTVNASVYKEDGTGSFTLLTSAVSVGSSVQTLNLLFPAETINLDGNEGAFNYLIVIIGDIDVGGNAYVYKSTWDIVESTLYGI